MLLNWWRGLTRRRSRVAQHGSRTAQNTRKAGFAPRLELLENRLVPSAGALDPTFGTGGKVTTDLQGSSQDDGQAVAVQADGKIVVAGSFQGIDFAVVRYNADGTLDATFGTGGKVITNFGPGFTTDAAQDLAIQSDGKIVVVGSSTNSVGTDFAVARYNADGTLDASFGTGGLVTTNFGGTSLDAAQGVAIQADGKIVVTGSSNSASPQDDFAVVRYNADGSLDTGFGTGGKVTTDFAGSIDDAFAVALQADGKIVAAG